MGQILKIFASNGEQDQIAKSYPIVERYDSFVLADVPQDQVTKLEKKFVTEDISHLYDIPLGQDVINTARPRINKAGKTVAHAAYKGEKPLSKEPHHYLVQFKGPVKEEWLGGIQNAGGEVRQPYGDFTYVVRADEETVQKIAALEFVRWVGHYQHEARIDANLLQKASSSGNNSQANTLPRTRYLPNVYTIEFFGEQDVARAVPEVERLGIRILEQNAAGNILIVQIDDTGNSLEKIKELAQVHGVARIRERAINRPSNDVACGILASSVVTANGTGLGLSGEGEIIGICDTGLDTGDVGSIHQDFRNRIVAMQSYPITSDFDPYILNPGNNDGPADLDSGHGTHVAGSVLGDGASSAGILGVSAPIRGLAHQAQLIFQAVEQELKWKNPAHLQTYGRYLLAGIPANLQDLFADAYNSGARIHSNSWGGGDPGAYDEQCRQLDEFVWTHKDFCILVAAGNDGTDNDGDGKINPGSVTSPGTAKNCITVGASENLRPNFDRTTYGSWWPQDYPVAPINTDSMANNPDQVAAFSSRGPTADNRIKPDVVAPGTFVLSARSSMIAPNNMAWGAFPSSRSYFHMGGTSMATPLAAGAVALIREYLRKQKNIASPTAALLKAALIASTVRMRKVAPTGSLFDNDQGFGRIHLDGVVVSSTTKKTEFLDISAGLRTGQSFTHEFNVSSNATPLKVVLAYSDFPGPRLVNNLNLLLKAPNGRLFVGNQASRTRRRPDVNNNVEVMVVPRPAKGTYRIQVVGSNVPAGPQDFAIVYKGHLA